MSRIAVPTLPRLVAAEIERLGASFEWRKGTKHWKLFVNGRMAVVYSTRDRCREQDPVSRRRDLNAVRSIRRVVRETAE